MSMYEGNNPAAIQSQKWLSSALIDLMAEQPFSKITVKMICGRADLSRQTFYNVFKTKNDALRFRLRSNYEKLYSEISAQTALTVEDMINSFSEELMTDSELIRLMINSCLESVITDEIARCVELFAQRFHSDKQDEKLVGYGTAFVSGALSRILLHWFKSPDPISVSELRELILSMCSGEFFEL